MFVPVVVVVVVVVCVYNLLFLVFPELVHCGRKLKDELTLDACGVQPGSTVHILKKTWPEPESSPGPCLLLRSEALESLSPSPTPRLRICVFAEPVNRVTAAREFRVFHAALHSLNSAYRDAVSPQPTKTHSVSRFLHYSLHSRQSS